MKFYVEGENGKATVRLEMTKVIFVPFEFWANGQGEHEHQYKYRYLFVEFDPSIYLYRLWLTKVPGFQPKRIYLERVPDPKKPSSSSGSAASPGESKKGFLGINWGFESGNPRR
jgi:hypothetical protein